MVRQIPLSYIELQPLAHNNTQEQSVSEFENHVSFLQEPNRIESV